MIISSNFTVNISVDYGENSGNKSFYSHGLNNLTQLNYAYNENGIYNISLKITTYENEYIWTHTIEAYPGNLNKTDIFKPKL